MNKQTLSLVEFILITGFMVSLTALSISTLLPAFPQIESSFQLTSNELLPYLVTFIFFGMFIGELILGPLSDAKGRKPVLICAIIIYLVGTIIAITAQSIEMLLFARFVQGIGVAGPKSICMAIVRDQYQAEAMARIMSFVLTIFIFTPMIAPTIGQLVTTTWGWRAIFIMFLIQATLVTVWFSLRQSETLAKHNRIPFKINHIIANTQFILSQSTPRKYILLTGIAMGIHFTFVSLSQGIFADIYQIRQQFPLYFALLAGGIGAASIVNSQLVMRLGMYRLVQWAIWLLFATSLSQLILLQFNPILSFSFFISSVLIIFFCLGILFGNTSSLAMMSLGKSAGLGAALIGSLSTLLGAMIAIIIGYFYNDSMQAITLGYCALALIAVMIIQSAKPQA